MANSQRQDPYKSYNFIVAAAAVGVAGYLIARTLTSNLKSNVDSAFLRRIRFILGYPKPDPNNHGRKAAKARRPGKPNRAARPYGSGAGSRG